MKYYIITDVHSYKVGDFIREDVSYLYDYDVSNGGHWTKNINEAYFFKEPQKYLAKHLRAKIQEVTIEATDYKEE